MNPIHADGINGMEVASGLHLQPQKETYGRFLNGAAASISRATYRDRPKCGCSRLTVGLSKDSLPRPDGATPALRGAIPSMATRSLAGPNGYPSVIVDLGRTTTARRIISSCSLPTDVFAGNQWRSSRIVGAASVLSCIGNEGLLRQRIRPTSNLAYHVKAST